MAAYGSYPMSATMDGATAKARVTVAQEIDRLQCPLEELSLDIHSHPELCYEEVHAHDVICAFLEANGFTVTRHTYGLDTSFEAEVGSGKRLVIYCAEYDALPGIGHACGHNLIALSSIAAFVATAKAAVELGLAGRVRLLGTPAEEGGGGKVKLLDAGAFRDATVALMSHPVDENHTESLNGYAGCAGMKSIAARRLHIDFHGSPAHAGATPWMGRNALDAAVAAYTSVSMLRQQVRPSNRIHGVITDGGKVANIIPAKTSMLYGIRSDTAAEGDELEERVRACFDAAAIATGCKAECKKSISYADLIVNLPLCDAFTEEMGLLGDKYLSTTSDPTSGSTDMGNVSQTVPSFHCFYGIQSGAFSNHTPEFAAAAALPESLARALRVGKGLSMLGLRILMDDDFCERTVKAFEKR